MSALPLRATRDAGLWLHPECTCAAAERLTVTAYVHLPIFMIFSKWKQINQMCELNNLCDLSFSFKNDDDFGEVWTLESSNQKASHVPFKHHIPNKIKTRKILKTGKHISILLSI